MLVQSSRGAANTGCEVCIIFYLDISREKKKLPRQNGPEGEIWPGNREFCGPYEKFDRY